MSSQPPRPPIENRQRILRKARFESIKYTYFAVVASYPKSGYRIPEKYDPLLISQTVLGGQLFKETDTKRKVVGNLVKEFDGWIPFSAIKEFFDEILGIETVNSHNPASFTDAYKNWEYKWEVGIARYKYSERYANADELSRKNKKGQYLYRIGGRKDGKAKKVYPRELLTEVKNFKADRQGEVPQFNWEKNSDGVRKAPKRKGKK